MRRFLIPVLVFIAVFVVSCDEDKKTNNGGSSEAKPVEEVSQDIPAEEGGKIEAETKDEAVSIEIPGGALDEDVKITMKIYDADGYKGTEGLDVISKVVEFEPSGTVFKKPVIITMKTLKDVGSVTRAAKKKVITAAVYREEKGAWSYSPIGAAVKISGRSEGGDPIMTSAAGDPIMLNAGGDPIMMPSSGGDPIMLSAAGDPIMVTAAGDPIMNSAAGDPIMMTTGHFSSYTFLVVDLEAEAEPDDGITDNDITDNDITDIEDNDDTDDSDTDTHESSGDDPCDPNPCGSIENSNGVCHVIFLGREGDIMSFACDCIDSYGWDGLGCSPVDMSDPCESDPCTDIAHSDGECYVVYNTDHVKTFSCGCEAPYSWDGSKCSSSCADDPCSTVYHSNGICYPKPDGKYECGCAENYYWDGPAKKCSNPCTADPCGSVPHTTGCVPKTGTEYVCTCEEVYSWDGIKCVSPCDSEPCSAFEHTTVCTAQAPDFYSCKCDDGFYWWGTVKGCITEQPTVGRICTSQFKCYDESKEIPCPAPGEPFYGQDATKAREGLCAPKSFTIVETGIENEDIVRDDNTGLEWMRTPDESGDYRWSGADYYCENLEYGGYDDWRLSTPREYMTIVHNNRWPTIDMNYFDIPLPADGSYYDYISWASYSAPYGNYWGVNFESGAVSDYGNNPTNFVRCVRGETMPESSFIIPEAYEEAEEKIVVDTVTGLQWQYHDADVPDNSSFWKGALDYCENLTYAGFSDWRLPNKDELMTIVDFGRSDPASAFPDLQAVTYLLTSTTMPDEHDAVFRLYLTRGSMNTTMYKNSAGVDYHVHCVRSE